MAEYIVREKLGADFELCNKQNPRWTPQRVASLIARANAADVVEVVHGRWIISRRYEEIIEMEVVKYTCSVCNEYRLSATGLSQATNYCPNCGARMDGADVQNT